MRRLAPLSAPHLLALLALLALAPPSAAEQGAGPPTVPTELAIALIGDPDATLVVGEAAGPLAGLALPPGARVIGGMTQARGSTTVVGLALDPEAALDAAAAALGGDAWRPAPRVFAGRIFEDSGAPERPRMFCGPDASLRITAGAGPGGGSVLRYVQAALPGGFTVCNPPPGFARDRPIDAAPTPLLINPEGLRQRGGGMSGGAGSREAATRLTTSMGSVELASHYARQLSEQGWTPLAASEAPESVVQSWRRQGEDGRRWHALLLVTPLADGSEKEVVFQVWDPAVQR